MKLNPHTLLKTHAFPLDTLNLGAKDLIIKEERRKPREQITVLGNDGVNDTINDTINNKNGLF